MKRSLVILTFAFILIGLLGITLAENDTNGSDDDPVACTMDARACPDGSYVGRVAPDCKFAPCPGEDDDELEDNEAESEDDEGIIVGNSCGTVTPGYNNECCINEGYEGWDEENFRCIGEPVREWEREGNMVGSPRFMGANREERCEEWNCTRWSECAEGNQTRQCVQTGLNCEDEDENETEEDIPKLIKRCDERERMRPTNHTFECPENCECTGSTVKCEFGDGRTMTVYAGQSGNIIVQVKNVNVSTNVTLYKADGKMYGNFSGNRTKEIHLPDEVMEKMKERHEKRLQLYNESINLSDDGYYHIEAKKRSRLFWLIPVKEHMSAQVDAETGEAVKIRNPWWGFLARDVREDNTEED
ncbi:MAG: hypothetical protein ACP5NZ_01015 [Nanobdellota archaeon]